MSAGKNVLTPGRLYDDQALPDTQKPGAPPANQANEV